MSPPDATAAFLQQLLLWVVLPGWVASGVADWYCHKVERIEHSAGFPESLLHLAMLGELGLGVLAAAVLEINAAVLWLLLVLCVLHEATMLVDLAYAARRRRIPVAEQWVHGVQQAAPWFALLLLAAIHHPQALAAIGLGAATPDWQWRFKTPPLPPAAWGLVGLGGLVLVGCFVGEASRSWRERHAPARALP